MHRFHSTKNSLYICAVTRVCEPQSEEKYLNRSASGFLSNKLRNKRQGEECRFGVENICQKSGPKNLPKGQIFGQFKMIKLRERSALPELGLSARCGAEKLAALCAVLRFCETRTYLTDRQKMGIRCNAGFVTLGSKRTWGSENSFFSLSQRPLTTTACGKFLTAANDGFPPIWSKFIKLSIGRG